MSMLAATIYNPAVKAARAAGATSPIVIESDLPQIMDVKEPLNNFCIGYGFSGMTRLVKCSESVVMDRKCFLGAFPSTRTVNLGEFPVNISPA